MAGGSLFTLLDDIATLLDDVAVLTKVAAKKTAGVLGDDLALNAEQVAGVVTERELPVIWAVFKGSAINKLILVPAALAISAVAHWAILPLLMCGGAFLCFEGCEKLVHKWLHRADVVDEHAARLAALQRPEVDMVAYEKDKIRGAIRTDLILSAEIVVISLGTVTDEPLMKQALVLSALAAVMTVGVYGLVAGIVKIDDAGLALQRRSSAAAKRIGRGLLVMAPWLMKGLTVAGTIAMFLVGGGILAHGIPPIDRFVQAQGPLVATLVNAGVGVLAGAVLVAVVTLVGKLRARRKAAAEHPRQNQT